MLFSFQGMNTEEFYATVVEQDCSLESRNIINKTFWSVSNFQITRLMQKLVVTYQKSLRPNLVYATLPGTPDIYKIGY